jgi:hypothetical protein
MSAIKTVQSGSATIAAGTSSGTASITAVDLSKSFLMYNCRVTTTGVGDASNGEIVGYLTSTTQISFERLTGTGNAANIRWFVIEFLIGVTVQQNTTLLAPAATPHNVTITTVDTTKSWSIVNHELNGNNWSYDDIWTSEITTATNIQFQVGSYATASRLAWQVIEYTDCSVEKVSKSLDAASTSDTSTITSVTTSKAAIFGRYRFATDEVILYTIQWIWRITDSTTITYSRQAAGSAINNGIFYVVNFSDSTTIQRGNESITAATSSGNISISEINTRSACVNTQGLAGLWASINYTNDYCEQGEFTTYFSSTTQITWTRDTAGNAGSLPWEVIDFPIAAIPQMFFVMFL